MNIETKGFYECKLSGPDDGPGSLEGYAAIFGNVDHDQEVIAKGAFSRTLSDFKSSGFLAEGHDFKREIGSIDDAFEDMKGLYIRARFYSTPDAQLVRRKMQEKLERGRAPGMSIGYRVKQAERRGGVRHLLEIDLIEASVVTLPANTQARVSAVKSMNGEQQMTPQTYESQRWSDALIASPEFKTSRSRKDFSATVNLTIKAAGDPITTTQFGTRVDVLGLVPHPLPPANILPLINVQPITGGSIRYYQPTMPVTGGPGWTAEAAAKPEIQPRWTPPVDAPLETISEWVAVTLQALQDVPQLAPAIDNDLRRALLSKLDDSLLNGSGTTPEITGLLHFAGVQSIPFASGTLVPDMIAKGISAINDGGYGLANGVVMNPTDWWAVRTLRISAGSYYLWGSPAAAGLMDIYGVPVVTSTRIAAGTALVGDFNYATFYQRQGVTFIVGRKNDDLVKNLETIVCEMRGTLAVSRPQAFAKVALA